MKAKYAVLDVETTGFCPWNNEIIEIACIFANEKYEPIETFHSFVKPEYSWSEEAEDIHKISRSRARGFPNSMDVYPKFYDLAQCLRPFGGAELVVHARPVKTDLDLFDRNMLFHTSRRLGLRDRYYWNFPEDKIKSTILKKPTEARARWGVQKQNLAAWGERLGIEFNHHSALEDVRLTLEVLKFQEADQVMG